MRKGQRKRRSRSPHHAARNGFSRSDTSSLVLILVAGMSLATTHSFQQHSIPGLFQHTRTRLDFVTLESLKDRGDGSFGESVWRQTLFVPPANSVSANKTTSDGITLNQSSSSFVNKVLLRPAPLYITIGPPCAGKTHALAQQLEQDGYNPEAILSPSKQQSPEKVNIALDEQSEGVYQRIPVASFLFPSTRLDTRLGNKVLRSGVTVRERLLGYDSVSPSEPNGERQHQPKSPKDSHPLPHYSDQWEQRTDTELRNVILRVAGRMTPQEFSQRTLDLAQEVGDQVRFFQQRREQVAHDLAQAVEQVSVQAVGEVLFRMVQPPEPMLPTNTDNNKTPRPSMRATPVSLLSSNDNVRRKEVDDSELPYDEHDEEAENGQEHEEDSSSMNSTLMRPSNNQTNSSSSSSPPLSDSSGVPSEPKEDKMAALINTTEAHLLSAKALIKTPFVRLFIPQAIFNGGLDRAESNLQLALQRVPQHIPVSWGNTNTRPNEYDKALRAAQRAGRPVVFVAWGTSPYLPAVPRVELLRRSVSRFRETGKYIPAGAVAASLGRVERLMQEAEKEAVELHEQCKLPLVSNSPVLEDARKMDAQQPWNQYVNVALAALAGFAMDGEGFVARIGEPRNLSRNNKEADSKRSSGSKWNRRKLSNQFQRPTTRSARSRS